LTQEFAVQKVSEDFVLDFSWQLIEQFLLRIIVNSLISIKLPFELEESFHILLQLLVNRSIAIKVLEESKEPREIVTIVELRVQLFVASKNLNEYAHDVGKYSNSEEENDWCAQPLNVRPWVIITKAYGWKTCKGKIHHYQANSELFLICLLVSCDNAKVAEEIVWVAFGLLI